MKNLTALRKSKGLKQSDVAKAIGVSVAAYGFYETDRRQANYETLTMLADYFQTSIDYLLGRTELNTPPLQWTEKEKATGLETIKNASSQILTYHEIIEFLDLCNELKIKKGEQGLVYIKNLIKIILE